MSQTPPNTMDEPASAADSESLYEVVDGHLVEMPPKGIRTHRIATRIYNVLSRYLDDNRIGLAAMATLFHMVPEPELKRRPDVAFVSFERWPEGRDDPEEGDWEVVPDLAIEVISPNDTDRAVHEKLAEYFRLGVRRVWLVRPWTNSIYSYSSMTTGRIFGPGDLLEDADLLPGFRLPVDPLFRRSST